MVHLPDGFYLNSPMLKRPWKSKKPLSFVKTGFKKPEDTGTKCQNFDRQNHKCFVYIYDSNRIVKEFSLFLHNYLIF